ncbi:hypothetical protein [Kribbella sp. CA-294648]|uniref:hypothetical protein n=1 Tax=Kribbella sp. CA-294648 TaxID=3239948 RepID=UPI003D91046A
MSLKRVSALIAAALVAGAVATPASAAPTVAAWASADPCAMYVGAFDAAGNSGGVEVVATKPPTGKPGSKVKVFPVKESAVWYVSALTGSSWSYGKVISGTGLYAAQISWDGVEPEPEVTSRRLGGGWDRFTQIEESQTGYLQRTRYFYGLRDDGVLFRWNLDGFKALGSYPGFGAVKTMTMISGTGTYDTLLATTRGGALYTIRIPTTSPMKPIVKQVRAQGWGSFDSLVAVKCGRQSTLLTAVDHDTDAAYLYAVGHATGLTTPIQNLGKIPTPFPGVTHHAVAGETDDLFGE